MKRRFTILTAALALFAFLAIPMGMWGQTTETLNIADYADANDWTNATQYLTAQVGDVTFTAAGGGNTGKYYTSGENWRFYQNESATITISVPEGNNLTSITPTFSVTNNGALFNGSTQIASESAVAVSGTSVTFSVGNSGTATNGQVRFTEIEVTYATGGVILPSITAANVDIAYNATSGNIEYTINNPVEGGVLSAATEAAWLTIGTVGAESVPFTCTANEGAARTATVSLTYAYNRETVTKDVTVAQAAAPASYTTIPDLFAAATTTETPVYVTFNNWVVSGVSTNGKNVFVTDNNGNGFVIFNNNGGLGQTYSVGNILSGTAVSCTLKKYNGFAELLNVNANDLTITTGGTITEANVAMADLAGVNTGALVHYENLTCSVSNNKYYLSDGTTTLQVYNALYAFDALEDGKTYNITGIYQQYNSTKEILPRSAEDIVEVVAPVVQYNLTISNLVNVNTFVFDAGDQSEMLLEGAGTLQVYGGTEILISVDVEEGYILESLIVDDVDVTSQMDETGAYTFTMPAHDVTITASAMEPPTPGNWVLTPITSLTSHDVFVIVGNNGSNYAMPNDNGTSAPVAVPVTVVEGTISGEPAANLQWQMTLTHDGYIFHPYGDTEKWLYCTNTNNGVHVGTGDAKYFNRSNGYLTTTFTVNENVVQRYIGIYTATGATVAQDWRCYLNTDGNIANQTFAFYKRVLPTATFNYSVNGEVNSAQAEVGTLITLAVSDDLNDDFAFVGWTTDPNDVSNPMTSFTFENEDDEYTFYAVYMRNSTGDYYTRVVLGSPFHTFTVHGFTVTGPTIVPPGNILDNTDAVLTNELGADHFIIEDAEVRNVSNPFDATVLKNIAATDFGTLENPTNGGYYLIATPIEGFDDFEDGGFITNNYDLYAYDATEDYEWINLRTDSEALIGYHGYLYASSENTTLRFEGLMNDFDALNDGWGSFVELAYEEGDDDLKRLTFLGNSGTGETTFMVYDYNDDPLDEFNYLTLNSEGDGFVLNTDEMVDVPAFEAVLVYSSDEGQYVMDEYWFIGKKISNLNVRINDVDGGLLDNALISFGDGTMVKKFYLNNSSTRVYIPAGDNEYALVRTQGEGEMPVNFKARQNGTYVISVDVRNLDMTYLHLIDNLTGADIDLLQTPSYTFEANSHDYASRFRLVFNANDIEENSTTTNFAFFDGSNWVISNTGEATLQVVDVMGRVLSTETLDGNTTINLNQTPGVYMLRLINGENVSVQKVVVR